MTEKDILDMFFDEAFIVKFLGIKRKTLKTYLSEGNPAIPPMIKFGIKYYCLKEDFKKWLAACPKKGPVGLSSRKRAA